MFKHRAPKSYFKSAMVYMVLLVTTGAVLVYSLMDLRNNQIPFKASTDNLAFMLTDLHNVGNQIMLVEASKEAFFLGDPQDQIQAYAYKNQALKTSIQRALDHDLVIDQPQVSASLNQALVDLSDHKDQFEVIALTLYDRGYKGYGLIQALELATHLIEFNTYVIEDPVFYKHVLLLEKHVNQYLLYGNQDSLDTAFNLINDLQAMFGLHPDTKADLNMYTVLLEGYTTALKQLIEVDHYLGLSYTGGQRQIFIDLTHALEESLTTAAGAMTVVVNKNMDTSQAIMLAALVMMLLIASTFILQNRAFMATHIEKRRTEENLDYISNYDANTGLPNQNKFEEMVSNHLAALSHEGGLMIAVAFKEIEDLGKIYGRKGLLNLHLLISKRLQHFYDKASMGLVDGGHFMVLVQAQEDLNHCQALIDHLRGPYDLADDKIYLSPYLGIATTPEDAHQAHDLIEKANMALGNSSQDLAFFNASLQAATRHKMTLTSRLRQAIDKKAFFLVYQPIMDLKAQKIMGTEALIRWVQDDGSFISPATFIPLAEETGLIMPMTNWVIQEAFDQSAKWQAQGMPLKISINLSAASFADPGLLAFLEDTLAKTGARAENIALELTEYSLMNDEDQTLHSLRAIKAMGFNLYLDDFGTGYSSLSYVHKLPIDTLKVDRTFIMDYPEKKETTILEVCQHLSHQFGMSLVVEGIENQAQHQLVRDLGCSYGQGYLFSKPLKVEELQTFYKASNL